MEDFKELIKSLSIRDLARMTLSLAEELLERGIPLGETLLDVARALAQFASPSR
mgnify:CR=1 FL=1